MDALAKQVARRFRRELFGATSDIYDIRKPMWDVAQAAKNMDRFEFIAYFVARQTRLKKNRRPSEGYWVKKTSKGWAVFMNDALLYPPTKNFSTLFETMRRSPLNYHVEQAEHLRMDILTDE